MDEIINGLTDWCVVKPRVQATLVGNMCTDPYVVMRTVLRDHGHRIYFARWPPCMSTTNGGHSPL